VSGNELACPQVRHTADEVGAGETVILTLADKGVLDEEDGDELENVLAVSPLFHACGLSGPFVP